MHEISIIDPRTRPAMFSVEDAQHLKLIALIDPPCDTILIDERVAELRSLRGFSPLSHQLLRAKWVVWGGKRYYSRRSKVKESERQMAKISISHDEGYSTAVCIAFDRPFGEDRDKEIIDDGKGLPLHEPIWGDEGWFDQDQVNHEKVKPPGCY